MIRKLVLVTIKTNSQLTILKIRYKLYCFRVCNKNRHYTAHLSVGSSVTLLWYFVHVYLVSFDFYYWHNCLEHDQEIKRAHGLKISINRIGLFDRIMFNLNNVITLKYDRYYITRTVSFEKQIALLFLSDHIMCFIWILKYFFHWQFSNELFL